MTEMSSTSNSLLWEALPDLTLNIAQTATLCGISVRQLGYWTRQGYVSAQGQGARRTYGLEAIQRVLAIRKAMDAGASLRQALRAVGVSMASPALFPATVPSEPSALLPEEAEGINRSLQAFFQGNRYARDHAGGLSVKLGHAEEDVRLVAERLCSLGVLVKNVCQGMTIFRQAGTEAAHG